MTWLAQAVKHAQHSGIHDPFPTRLLWLAMKLQETGRFIAGDLHGSRSMKVASLILGARRGPELKHPVAQITNTGGRAACHAGGISDPDYAAAFIAAKVQLPVLPQQEKSRSSLPDHLSGSANERMPGMVASAASKAGLTGLVQSMTTEHAVNRVRINAFLPGGTRTPMAGDVERHAPLTRCG